MVLNVKKSLIEIQTGNLSRILNYFIYFGDKVRAMNLKNSIVEVNI